MSDKNAEGVIWAGSIVSPGEQPTAGPASPAPDIPPTMTCRELADRIKRGEKWKMYEPAPDEALIEEIARKHYAHRAPIFYCIKDAIREYIRRSAGKEKG